MVKKILRGFEEEQRNDGILAETQLLELDSDVSEEEFWESLLEMDPNPNLLVSQRHEIRQHVMRIEGYLEDRLSECRSERKKRKRLEHLKQI
ncbi:MAG: hypothetical protein H6619_05665 [Deltaproteobacteria bacterium]|nr:hypothetical protein [Deltaproteobacteria bacterium]